MNLTFVSLKENWNEFLLENRGSFLQSFEWGEFQKSLSKNIWRARITHNEKVGLQALVIKERMRFKSYFYIPYGPVFSINLPQ